MERGYKLKDRPEYKSKPRPITFKKTDTVAKAVKIMSEKNYGSVVIVDNQNKVIAGRTYKEVLDRFNMKVNDPRKSSTGKKNTSI